MMRDEVCQEFGAWYRGEIPEEVHWRAAEAMADEIIRLRAILAELTAIGQATGQYDLPTEPPHDLHDREASA